MKIYISGKITGLQEKEYQTNFFEAYKKLKKIYNCPRFVFPIGIQPFLGIKKWLFYMINDIRELKKCTHIAMQPNWVDSKGAVIEYFFAKFIFKQQIIFLD